MFANVEETSGPNIDLSYISGESFRSLLKTKYGKVSKPDQRRQTVGPVKIKVARIFESWMGVVIQRSIGNRWRQKIGV